RFLQKLLERGYEPYLVSFHPQKAQFQMGGVKYFHYYPRIPRMKSLAIGLRLRKLLKQIKPNILHTGVIQSHGLYGALSGFHPTLLMPWGSDILHTPDTSLIMRWITKYTIKRADMIICDCELVKRKIMDLAHYPEEKIVVFPWGIDLTLFQPKPNSIRTELGWADNKVLIMTRTFYPIYGIEFFIEALPQIIKEEPQTKVILVGSGPLENHYRQRISQLGLEDYIHFTGNVEQSLMSQYLNASDIYVTTTLTDGTSSSLLEAMACGLPVVVPDAPTYFEWVEDGVNGYIVPRGNSPRLAPRIAEFLKKPELWYNTVPWSPDASPSRDQPSPLVDRIIQLLKNPELRQLMGRRNYEIAQDRANWDRNFNKLEGLYRILASKRV
ncbi:glycosyltransferase family 4 protein, partial [Chloroflexota bacterium]